MMVEDTQLDDVSVGQEGRIVLSSLPDRDFPVEIVRITPRLEASDGRNVAVVEGRMVETSGQIRPGMRGVAKIDVEERLLIPIWAQPIIDWLRLALWRWTP